MSVCQKGLIFKGSLKIVVVIVVVVCKLVVFVVICFLSTTTTTTASSLLAAENLLAVHTVHELLLLSVFSWDGKNIVGTYN